MCPWPVAPGSGGADVAELLERAQSPLDGARVDLDLGTDGLDARPGAVGAFLHVPGEVPQDQALDRLQAGKRADPAGRLEAHDVAPGAGPDVAHPSPSPRKMALTLVASSVGVPAICRPLMLFGDGWPENLSWLWRPS